MILNRFKSLARLVSIPKFNYSNLLYLVAIFACALLIGFITISFDTTTQHLRTELRIEEPNIMEHRIQSFIFTEFLS